MLSENDEELNISKNIHLKEFLKLCEENEFSFNESFENMKYLNYILHIH